MLHEWYSAPASFSFCVDITQLCIEISDAPSAPRPLPFLLLPDMTPLLPLDAGQLICHVMFSCCNQRPILVAIFIAEDAIFINS